ncbi:PREDICTED: ribonuclease 3-like protein 3 [Camelina sativa]|uniref:Ribonuclease 3-like protein 3 n=1 Tax=Camelina sativa TaxID=90675 RepID=A0ABM0V696_CAMSA|nr:PREDICTED: ribonuclease 3-like protein 3 [Camelina sativa]
MESQVSNADVESLQSNLISLDNTKTNGSGPLTSTDPDQPLEMVEKILNYKFKDKSLLLEAFTDTSCDEDFSNERLEFIGDTILNTIVTIYIFNLYPRESPGSLTNLRAVNVDTEKLARVAVKHNLHRCLRHKKALLDNQILEFVEAIEKHPTLHSRGLVKVPKSLANIVESTIGALFMDCNSIETVWKVIKPLLEPIIHLDKLEIHPVTELYEMCQKRNLKLEAKDTWKENKEYCFYIQDKLVGRGDHRIKKETARNCAAKDAIANFSTFFGNH